MKVWPLFTALLLPVLLPGQTPCPPTPAYSPCEVVFELSNEEVRAHPNPYLSVTLEVEFRSPHFRTYRLPAFWDGENRIVARFAPTEAGDWDFRVTSNLERFDGKMGRILATPSDSPGFLRARNFHHWGYMENDQPHLWMGDTCLRFGFLSRDYFDKLIATRAKQKFNHIRGLVIGNAEDSLKAYPSPDRPNPEYFQEADRRILAMNRAGITADLILAGGQGYLSKLFPERAQHERYVRYLVARYAAMHVTWQGVQEFENYEDGRDLLKEIGTLLKNLDPYQHPRSTGSIASAGPLADDGWMTHIVYGSSDAQLEAIEHQLYALPAVSAGLSVEGEDAGAVRKRLWEATINGQYPVFGGNSDAGPENLDSPAARQMTVWYDFFSGTRHWELEPYFDVDGGRALALEIPNGEEMEGIEYIVYVEKPGPVEIVLQRQKYNVAWIDPSTGQRLKQKDFKGNRLTIAPPDAKHDWVLHISREDKKESMLRSYKFESRPILMQEVEQNAQRIPYEMAAPSGDEIRVGEAIHYSAKIQRDTRATRSMLWLWTAEVVGADGQGYRVLGTGPEGQLRIPAGIAKRYPAVMNLRLAGMNANGKVYFSDRVFKLIQ